MTPRVPPFNVIGTDTDRSATYSLIYSFGWEGKGSYGLSRLWMKRRVYR